MTRYQPPQALYTAIGGWIKGLLLRGGIKVTNLSWQGDSYELELLHPDGRITVQRK